MGFRQSTGPAREQRPAGPVAAPVGTVPPAANGPDERHALRLANHRLRLALDAADDAFVGMDAAGCITEWNRTAEAMFGWRVEEVAGRDLADTIVPARHREAHRKGLSRYLATGQTTLLGRRVEITAVHRDGREFPVEVAIRAVDGGPDGCSFFAYVQDISERLAQRDALRESETRHRVLAERLVAAQQIAGIGSWEWDVPANSVTWSEELCRIFGVPTGSHPSTYDDYLAAVHPEDRRGTDATIRLAHETGQAFSFDHRVVHPDGTVRIVHSQGDVTMGDDGTALRLAGTAQDVTDSVAAAVALRDSERALAEAQRIARLGSWEWDLASGRGTWSAELYSMLALDPGTAGVEPEDFVAAYRRYLDAVHPEDRAEAESAIGTAIETRQEYAFDHRLVGTDGAVTWVQGRIRAEVDDDGVPSRVHGTAVDITERVALEQKLTALALFDDLTGLHNRRGFVTLADHHLALAARTGRPVPLLFVDMDEMKTINDTFGHNEGDRALVEVAAFLRSALRASDLVARVGGDEFCILMVDDGSGSATDVERVADGLRAGPPRGGRAYPLTLSVGVAGLEPGAGISVEDLMGRADGAMYEDKSAPRRRVRVLVVEDDPSLRRLAELSLRFTYDVTAATGAAALAEAAEQVPDLVLLDLNLPDLHGTEVLRRMREVPGGDRMSVIVMTAAAGPTTELESLHGGVDDFVTKPLDLGILEARMRNVLQRSTTRPRRFWG